MSCEPLVLAAIKLDENFTATNSVVYRMRPTLWDNFADDAARIHGISKEVAMSYPPKGVGLEDFLAWVGTPHTFVCHANKHAGRFAAFDYAALQVQYLDNFLAGGKADHFQFARLFRHVVSTHTLAMATMQLDGYSLDKVCRHIGFDLKHHDAVSDAEACAAILRFVARDNDIWEIYGREQARTLQIRRGASKKNPREETPAPYGADVGDELAATLPD
jgi:DNA polymerase III epsilon subunit-like protein